MRRSNPPVSESAAVRPRRHPAPPLFQRLVLAEDHRVLRTAAAELRHAGGLSAPLVVATPLAAGDAVLTLISHPLAAPLIEAGLTGLHNAAADADAFQVLRHEGILWILGSSPRGVMQGVHACTLADPVAKITPDRPLQGAFAFPLRIFSPICGARLYQSTTTPETIRAAVRYLSLLGASHLAATHDFAEGCVRDPHAYVASSQFPLAADPERRTRLRRALRLLCDAAADFGLDVLFDARLLPCQGGPWAAEAERQHFLQCFPGDVLADSGTYQGQVLCFSHPRVRAFYEETLGQFCADFPEIALFHYLTQDAEGEFCDPNRCPRCRGLTKFDQRDRLARFLAETLARARPGCRILNTSFQWDRSAHGVGELLVRQATLPAQVGLCIAASGDCATFERQAHESLRQARAVTRRAGQVCVGRDALHLFEDNFLDCRQIIDYPLGVFAKIKRWQSLGMDGFYDVRGRAAPGDLHANSVAVRAALLSPTRDAGSFCDDLACRWFGAAAGAETAAAWRLLEQAQTLLSNGFTFPSSSPLSQYVSWFVSRLKLPLPSNPAFTAEPDRQAAPLHGELGPAAALGWLYHAGDYAARLETTGRSLIAAAPLCAQAAAHLTSALARPLPAQIPDAATWLGAAAEITPAAYLRDHAAFLSLLHGFTACMGPYFLLKALRIRRGADTDAYLREGEAWLQEFARHARHLAEHLDNLAAAGHGTGRGDLAATAAKLRSLAPA